MASRITPKLEKEILKKAADGLSSREIAAWLLAERGVKVSFQAVAKRLTQTRTERAEVAKAVVREHLTKTVTSDLDRLAREQGRVERLTRRLYRRATAAMDLLEKAEPGVTPVDDIKAALMSAAGLAEIALKATDRVAKLAQVRLHFSGADTDDEGASELAEAEQRVRGRIDSLAESLGTKGSAGDDRADAARAAGS